MTLHFTEAVTVPVQLLDGAPLPKVAKDGDVAVDATAVAVLEWDDKHSRDIRITEFDNVIIPARGQAVFGTGLKVELPPGYKIKAESRSGLGRHHCIQVGAGVIDNGYRGEIGVILYNLGSKDYLVRKGDRIAQLCVERYVHPIFVEKDELSASARGITGWGSSGNQ